MKGRAARKTRGSPEGATGQDSMATHGLGFRSLGFRVFILIFSPFLPLLFLLFVLINVGPSLMSMAPPPAPKSRALRQREIRDPQYGPPELPRF